MGGVHVNAEDMALNLDLQLVEETSLQILFRLIVGNDAADKVLIPYPQIIGLEFTDAKGIHAEWYTRLLVSARWSGVGLEPLERKPILFRVGPTAVPCPKDNDHSDYYRWSVDLGPGRYAVKYVLAVNDDYFDGDSHYRLEDVRKAATNMSANVWTGKAESNVVNFEFKLPGPNTAH